MVTNLVLALECGLVPGTLDGVRRGTEENQLKHGKNCHKKYHVMRELWGKTREKQWSKGENERVRGWVNANKTEKSNKKTKKRLH